MQIFWDCLKEAVVITYLVFIMMMLVDYFNVWVRGRMSSLVKFHKLSQYVLSPLLAVFPGCMGAFMVVSFYLHGLISFGALTGAMITACGDEAFVMLATFPKKALVLFAILLGLGIVWGMAVDWLAVRLKIKTCKPCQLDEIHEHGDEGGSLALTLANFRQISFVRFLLLFILGVFTLGFCTGYLGAKEWDLERIGSLFFTALAVVTVVLASDHYLEEHIWEHLFKHHLGRVFCWSLGAILFVSWTSQHLNLQDFISHNMLWVFLLAGLVGLIPQSGPNLIFVFLFAQGTIPFPVLLTNSMVQDGHGMLPLLSYTVHDALWLKGLNLVFSLLVGLTFYFLGVR